jgi:hypothetical protein
MTEKTFAFKSGVYGLIPVLRGLFNCERNFGNYSLPSSTIFGVRLRSGDCFITRFQVGMARAVIKAFRGSSDDEANHFCIASHFFFGKKKVIPSFWNRTKTLYLSWRPIRARTSGPYKVKVAKRFVAGTQLRPLHPYYKSRRALVSSSLLYGAE